MNRTQPLHLFEGYGVELEFMLVERDSLNVAPLADKVLEVQAGTLQNEVEVGPLCWSNELVLHVIELKTNGPAPQLTGLAEDFQRGIAQIGAHLEPLGARLLPGGMHPWMNPLTETRLWPHGDSSIYAAYNRIFGCQGHGWSNLQSTHLNLPFCGDDEFARLHAAGWFCHCCRRWPPVPRLSTDGSPGCLITGCGRTSRTSAGFHRSPAR